MVVPKNVAVPATPEKARYIESPELIERMAIELRARSDADLPHAFYVDQVRRQLAGEARAKAVANDDMQKTALRRGEAHPSVFHAWALSE